MQSGVLRRVLLLAAGLAVLGTGALQARAAIYKYVDRAGVSHYTDSISQVPDEHRDQVREISAELKDQDGFHVMSGDDRDEAGGAEPEPDDLEPAIDLSGLDLGNGDVAGDLLQAWGFGIILLGLLAIPVLWVGSALILKLACKLAGEEPPGLGRACAILLAQSVCSSAVGAVVGGIGTAVGIDQSAAVGGAVAVGGASTLVSWMANGGILASMMSYGYGKSLWVGVLHTLLSVVMIGVPIGAVVLVAVLAA